MADHETSKLGGAQYQAVAAAEPGPPPGRGPGGALRRRLGIGGGVAIVVAATLFGGSVALARSVTGDAADPGATRPSASAEAPQPPAADGTGSGTPRPGKSSAARARPTTTGQALKQTRRPAPVTSMACRR